MTFVRIFTATSALALVAGPAFADLTAQEVWADWKDLLESYGAEVTTAGEDQSGDTLTVSRLAAAFAVEGGSMALELGNITFAEQGDGSVVVTMEDTLPFAMDIVDPDGKEGRIGFTLRQPGGRIVASGDAENLRYDFNYPTMTISDFTIEGDEVPEDMPVTLDMALTDMTGFITLTGGDLRSYESESNIASFSMTMDIQDPEEGSGNISFAMSDVGQTVRGTLADIQMDMSAAELADGMDYGGITNGITMTVGGAAIPFPPLSFAMDKSEGRIRMPMVPNPDAEQDFGLVMTMEGLRIDNMLWNMIDPAEQLPRDPATLVIDLGGSVILTEDFTSPEYAENMDAAPPGTIESLDINAIQLTLAGAELTGDGEFAFNNDMGMPLPSGTANLMLTGGNTLLDTLVGMGLVPEDQAMGARMMLGLFARPGDGPDTLVSTIEVNEDGTVLANGQRIK